MTNLTGPGFPSRLDARSASILLLAVTVGACTTTTAFENEPTRTVVASNVTTDLGFSGEDVWTYVGLRTYDAHVTTGGDMDVRDELVHHTPFTIEATEANGDAEIVEADNGARWLEQPVIARIVSGDGAFDVAGPLRLTAASFEDDWIRWQSDPGSVGAQGTMPAWVEDAAADGFPHSALCSNGVDANAWERGDIAMAPVGPLSDLRLALLLTFEQEDEVGCQGGGEFEAVALTPHGT